MEKRRTCHSFDPSIGLNRYRIGPTFLKAADWALAAAAAAVHLDGHQLLHWPGSLGF